MIIEDDVWIAANVVILPGVRIGRGSTVGAGSVITRVCLFLFGCLVLGFVTDFTPCRTLPRIACIWASRLATGGASLMSRSRLQ